MLSNALRAIPFTFVELFANDKPWITPTLKLLINMRHEAYRERNFSKYTHLKKKVKNEIQKAKENWIKSLKESLHGIWKMIKKPNSGFTLASSCNFDSPTQFSDLINRAFSAAHPVPKTANGPWKLPSSKQSDLSES